ncbi:MAG: Holliday junction resolvase RuvX [Dehalococcoidia bacterium]|nr:Holliday junction resolvase RuvX [Dehalococcoidia bacterium]
MAILGLDVGEKRIGVALAEGLLAIPLTVIDRRVEEIDMELIMALVEEYRAERIVVGLPRLMNGTIGTQAEEILSFSGALAEHVDIPVDTWDERLSTVTAERLLIDTGMKRKKRKGKLDAMAAAIILQAYLDGTNK